ncbi:MAG: PAS domain S-box protein [Methanomicrobiales archaeon]|nr:PAS domain S-box protein [Methanomicrobiales archaeon]MDI6877106.1 PAS domain S-box protein [Methanomicrobiales archaeon]
MLLHQDRIDTIKGILKRNSKGLTISELSQKVNLNRNSLAKYLEILLVSGQVEMESFGTAKVYYLSRRVPLSALLKFSTDLIVMLDGDLKVVQANDNFLSFFSLAREAILGEDYSKLPLLSDLPLQTLARDPNAEGEIVREICIPRGGEEVFFRAKMVPTVFDDGSKGVTLIAENITLRKQYEEQLKASEARYRAIVEDQTELICRRLPDGTITFVNDAYCRYFGMSAENLVGHKFFPGMPLTDLAHRTEAHRKMCPAEPVVTYEVRHPRPGGEVRWLQWTDRALYGEGGILLEIQSVGRDVTERRQAEQELRIMETAIASSIDGIAIFSPDAALTYANRAFLDISGYASVSDIAGKHFREIYSHDPGLVERLREIEQVVEREGKWVGSIDTIDAEGRPMNLHLSVTRVQDRENRTLCYLASVVDVTEQKHMEDALRSTYEKLQESIEFMSDPTFIVDREKRVVAWNHAMESLTGIEREKILGRTDYQAAFQIFEGSRPILVDLLDLPSEEIARSYPDVRRFGESIFVEAFVPSLHHGRGAYIWGKASRLTDSNGNYIGAIESIRDISDWKRAEESLRQVYESSRSALPR